MNISPEDIKEPARDEISRVLLRLIGDHRECKYCCRAFLPNDSTYEAGLELWKKLSKIEYQKKET